MWHPFPLNPHITIKDRIHEISNKAALLHTLFEQFRHEEIQYTNIRTGRTETSRRSRITQKRTMYMSFHVFIE